MLCTLNCCLSVAIYAVASSRLLPFINGHLSCAIEKTIPFINGQPCCNLLLYCSCAYSVVISCVLVNTALINGHLYCPYQWSSILPLSMVIYAACQRSYIMPLSKAVYTSLVEGHVYCILPLLEVIYTALIKGHLYTPLSKAVYTALVEGHINLYSPCQRSY